MLNVHKLNKYYHIRGRKPLHVIDNTTLEIPEKGIIAVVGESGAGKTTLINTISGLDSFKSGKISFDDVSMTRPEYESAIESAIDVARILEALGYKPVEPSVIKERTMYVKEDISACLDRVEGLGNFLELEILTDEDSGDTALEKLWEALELLGYDRADTTTLSYLSMLQKNK